MRRTMLCPSLLAALTLCAVGARAHAQQGNATEAEYAAIVARDPHNSRAIYRLADMRRGRDLDAAIALYRRYVALEPNDAWGYAALGSALAVRGNLGESVAAYDAAVRLAPNDTDIGRDRARVRRRAAAWIEPAIAGTWDSDATTTWFTGVRVSSPDVDRARLVASAGRGMARDPLVGRATFAVRVGAAFRPVTGLSLELDAGAHGVDRTFIDTAATPGGGAPVGGPGVGGGRPSAPIGRGPGERGGAVDLLPVGRARAVWRDAGNRLRIDARASRQVLDASPYLVAQGVSRDEIGAELDLRVVGALRVRALGRTGRVYNDSESNERRLVGAGIAWAPRAFEVSVRGQELSYGSETGLAYFAPRYVRTLEVTTYVERELGDVQIALDAGAGAQQVAAWTDFPSNWSPTGRLWMQLVKPLTYRLSLGADGEAYDSRVGTDMPSFALPEGRWRYGSLRLWLRTTM